MALEEGELLTSENDWLDMRVGDTATVAGKLEGIRYPGDAPHYQDGWISVTFAGWDSITITCNAERDMRGTKDLIPLQSDVRVRVERREDDLLAHAIWMPGSVPIPLTQ